MKQNFEETIHLRTDLELQRISKDTAFYSSEERTLALEELEKRGLLTTEQIVEKKSISDTVEIPMPDSVSIYPVFTRNMIWAGAVLGGPFFAGYMIAENFKTFNQPRQAKMTQVVTATVSMLYFVGLAFLPDTLPRGLERSLPFFPAIISLGFVEIRQNRKIASHRVGGGRKSGWGKVILGSLLGAAITFAVMFVVVFAVMFFRNLIER